VLVWNLQISLCNFHYFILSFHNFHYIPCIWAFGFTFEKTPEASGHHYLL
jgi:hypothetical protein